MNYQSLRQDELERVSSLFKILGHPKRLQLLYLLMQNRMTVSEISQALEWEQSAVSHQLQLLKQKAGHGQPAREKYGLPINQPANYGLNCRCD